MSTATYEEIDILSLNDKRLTGERSNMLVASADIFTLPANLAGIPALSIPCGFSREGLPVGLQILGKHFDEEKLIRVAYNYEQATDHHRRRPNL